MHPTGRSSRFLQTGFTLVELMVGLAIGLLATVVIIQVMSVFDAQRRATTGSADAQTNGGIALHTIAREMQMAGYPLFPAADSPLECTAMNFGTTGITSISPVTITDGATSDSIAIRYGNSAMGGVPSQITAVAGSDMSIGSNVGCRVGDIAMVVSGASCAMTSVTGPTDIATPPVASAPAKLTTVTLQSVPAIAVAGANLSCLGAWGEITYAVNATTGNLERTSRVNGVATAAVPSVVGVVNMQVQYGISATAASNQIAQWVNASGTTWTAPSVNDRKRIKAIRIAVVSRNENMATSNVTATCSSTTTPSPTGLCAWEGTSTSPAPSINLSADANWQRYRYRVFDTIIPLRNVIWSKDTL
jgi:type IV pilus assembly protein PilW